VAAVVVDSSDQTLFNAVSLATSGGYEVDDSSGTINDSRDQGGVHPEDQVSFSMAAFTPIVSFLGTVDDRTGVLDR
jgi:hypothetical protein